jgi:hypothetical protein
MSPLPAATWTYSEDEAVLADSVGDALLVILDLLAPAERLAFVLHDMFAVPFDEIAAIVGCSSAAARQLASRARRRVQGADRVPGADRSRQREVVAAFLAASRNGHFDALLALLDPDVVLRAARPARVDGAAGAVWAPGGQPRVVFGFMIAHGKIVAIEMTADPVRLSELDLAFLDQ